MKRILFLAFAGSIILVSCKKDDVPEYNSNVKAPLTVEFDNIVGAADLQLGTGSYINGSGETFTVSKLKYYISNLVLTKTDGTVYVVPQDESYFLVDESDVDSHEAELSVPEGEYKTLDFTIGVDSVRSTMDISQRTGVLDPTLDGGDMYWSWNSGYIFLKFEGNSTASAMGDFAYHIGGFGGYSSSTLNNIKKVSLNLTTRGVPKVKTGKETNIHLFADLLKIFNGSTNLSIAANPMVMFNPYSVNIAGNYANMFKHDHTEN